MRQLVVSDTNIWFDLLEIGQLTLPLRLPCRFLMEESVAKKEISEHVRELVDAGLMICQITTEELYFSQQLLHHHNVLSVQDTFGLAIAMKRNLSLFTGDKRMRAVAMELGVEVKGTLWLLDELFRQEILGRVEYAQCVRDLIDVNDRRRLPIAELEERLEGGAHS